MSSLRSVYCILRSTMKLLPVTGSKYVLTHAFQQGMKYEVKHYSLMTVQKRFYAVDVTDSIEDLRTRVMNVLSLYDKIEGQKITLDSHFENDLGLDSLDHVELIMAMEDEFGFEIPESHATRMERPSDIVKYIAEKGDDN